jgi:predicted aconitase with swiveling domain
MAKTRISGRIIFEGTTSGKVLKSDVPLGFFGHLDPETGIYKEQGHPLDGVSIKGRVLVFPRGKGSTVGSYILYGLKKAGNAPAAMVMTECDTIVAVGALIGEIPTVDGVEMAALENEQQVRVEGGALVIEGSLPA